MIDAPDAPDVEPPGPREGPLITMAPACRCRESRRTVLPNTTHASTAPACSRCGAHTVVLMPAAYIACFLYGSMAPERVVRVRCDTCDLHRHVLAADVHDVGCVSLSSSHAPAPDPLHIHRIAGAP